MGGTVYAGFNTARIGSLGAVVTDDDVTGVAAAVESGRYAHVDISSVMGTGRYTDLAAAFQAAIRAITTVLWTVTFSSTTRAYTITNPDNDGFIDFREGTAGAVGPRLAKALGITSANSAVENSDADPYSIKVRGDVPIVSDATPYYLVPLGRDALSGDGGPHVFNPGGQVRSGVTVNGNALAVRPTTLEQRLKARAAFNDVANVFSRNADDSEPWTLEDLVEHAWASEPVYVKTATEGFVGKLVGQAAEWTEQTRQRSIRTYEGLWHWDFEMRVLGEI